AILSGHPACANRCVRRMRSTLRGREVVARERFWRDEESVRAFQRQESGKESPGQLPVTMTNDPHLSQLRLEGTHDRITRRSGNLEMALLEGPNLLFRRDGNRHRDAHWCNGLPGQWLEHVLPPMNVPFSVRNDSLRRSHCAALP